MLINKKNTQKIYNKLSASDRKEIPLVIDRVYEANPNIKHIGAEVLSKMFKVGNSGGFRIVGSQENPLLIVLYTTGENVYWKDELDRQLGLFTYYGDNQKPGFGLHETKLGGNKALREIFSFASSSDFDKRVKIPPIFVFEKTYSKSFRDVKFLGLAVPGYRSKRDSEWLTAVWANRVEGGRFQNYKALFTILDTSSGSTNKRNNSEVSLAWIDDILNRESYESQYAPYSWKSFIKDSIYTPLVAKPEKIIRKKEEQLPNTKLGRDILDTLTKFYNQDENGLTSYDFESFAIDITKAMNPNIVELEPTQKVKDGGFDGIGLYRIFDKVENSINVEFFLEAKCYSINNGIGVKQTSRLISRIRNRQFGILFTTSYVSTQAYEEILDDQHPIVIITGKDIVEFVVGMADIKTIEEFKLWLQVGYGVENEV